MSPIRPALGAVNPRPPDPPGARPVRCPACAHLFPASRRALSIRCPRCTTPLRLEDYTFRRNASTDIRTHGHVRVTSASSVSGELVCGQLTNSGRFSGSAIVHGPVELIDQSFTTGHIAGQSLRVGHGSVLRATVVIAPSILPAPRGMTGRPASVASPATPSTSDPSRRPVVVIPPAGRVVPAPPGTPRTPAAPRMPRATTAPPRSPGPTSPPAPLSPTPARAPSASTAPGARTHAQPAMARLRQG